MHALLEYGLVIIVVIAYGFVKWRVAGSCVPGAATRTPTNAPPRSPLALQDWLVGGYVLALWCLVYFGDGSRRPTALVWITADAFTFAAFLAIARAPRTPRVVADIAYRIALPGAIVSTFSQLHYLLPTARADVLDARIFALDQAVFGFEPSVAWDAYVTPATTEGVVPENAES